MTETNRLPPSFHAQHEKQKTFTMFGIAASDLSLDDLLCVCAFLNDELQKKREEVVHTAEIVYLAAKMSAQKCG